MALAPQPGPALTTERSKTLRAVVGRVLPGVEGPGAVATDAAAGFEQALRHPFMRGLRPGVEALLDRLQAGAAQLHSRDFAVCSAEQQDDLLRALERDPSPWTRWLFRSLIAFSLEGLLGDPSHGGNRDCLGWQSAGLAPGDVRAGLCRGGTPA